MLHTHDDFLNAIDANPSDCTVRLVYADWLDEHADPRAELIRVEEEMRALPVFADRFWELKPRRNELRALAGVGWCAKLRYGTECAPVFTHGIPDGWRERWRLIREFTERWHRVPMGDVGGRQAEIEEAEARLGRKLPPSVREWIAFAHDQSPPDAPRLFIFSDAYSLEELPGHPAISLSTRAETPHRWAIRHRDLGQPDPPICGYRWENQGYGHFELDEFGSIAGTLTECMLRSAMFDMRGEAGGFEAPVNATAQLCDELAAAFQAPTRFEQWDIYEAANIIALVYHHPESKRTVNLRVEVAASRSPLVNSLRKYVSPNWGSRGIFNPRNARD